jgi:autotransporter-associated beta strand protein
MISVRRLASLFILSLALKPVLGATNLSVWAFPGPSGRLICQPDALGNRILDFSGVGYMGGSAPLPSSNVVPVKVTISPVAGDNVANIQTAINQVSAMPMDTNGFRGAVLLSAGLYPCAKTITISASGVVLRGVGSSTNGTGTVLEATATNQYTLLEITGSGSASSGSTHNITNKYIPVGARSFYVDSTNGLSVGSEVFVRRVATSNWIHDLGMDLLGPPPDVPWTASGYMIDMDRVITHLEGNHVFVDAPITCAIDAHYTNGTIRPFTWSGLITNVGIEHIYAKSDYFGSNTNETHGWTFIQFDKTINGWVRDVVSQYFGYSCVNLNSGDKFITVQDCQSLDPVSIITGGRRYAFAMNDVQYCLVKNCYTRQDRHQFVTQSLTIGPNVFVDGLSDNAHAEAGPHQRWATGDAWDNITVHGGNNDIQNAGNYGTGHGWEGSSCVIWNNAANGFIVQNPPGAHNWLIGSVGPIQNGTAWNIGYTNMPHAPGDYDSSGSGATNVFPDSLYFAQLQDRHVAPRLQTRDYWLGDIDQFTNSIPGGDRVPLDLTWSNAVRSAASGQPLDAFDIVTNNHWVPFTFNFSLSPNEHVVAATLSVAMRALTSAAGDTLYLNSPTNAFTFTSLGWLPVGTGTNITVRVLDLTAQTNLFANGQMNVAVQGDIGLDWAMLELHVAPNISALTTSLTPAADATVRGGTNSGINFGSAATLTVRQDKSTNNIQQAYLRWDLTGVSGTVAQAQVVLTPVSVGASGIEQGVAVANSNNWAENTLTWNNQPGYGERFATWLAPTSAPISFDVTPQVLDALNGDRQLSLALFSITSNSVDYASGENSNPALQPQLVLSLLGSPPGISAIADRTIAVNSTTGPIPFTIGGGSNAILAVSGSSSNPDLVPDSNIVFGGSGTNRTVTVTPAANQSGITVISVTVTDSSGLTATSSFTLTVSSHPASVHIWNGPGSGSNPWSSAGNWSPAQIPEFLDDVKFFDPGATGLAVSNINNYVDVNFGGNIASLQYGNTNGNHTTLLATGSTLTLSGANGLIAGTETENGNAQTVFSTITGPGGALVIDNPGADLIVRQGTTNSSGSQRATLDMSGLGTFAATLNQILVGCAGPQNRQTGTLYFGRTNTVTLTGTPGILAGDNHSNGGGQNFIYLGIDNAIFADSITIARQKATATLKFFPGLVNPSALFRASDGTSRIASWNIADNSLQSSSSSSAIGTNDFSAGTVDALVDTLIVGKSQQTTGANSSGTLTFTSGTLDVNTLQIGFQAANNATSAGIGRVNVSGTNAALVVNTLLELGHTSGGSGSTNTFGSLFVSGGSVTADTIAVGLASGTNILALTSGTLAASTVGASGSPVGLVALTNSELQLPVTAGSPSLFAATLLTGGVSNLLTITSLPTVTSLPTQFPLIQYSGFIGGSGFNFRLGSLPPGALYGASLSNNLPSHTVDLVITNVILPDPFLTWDGTFDGDWDTETANWKNNVANGLTYADGNAVVFNDSAAGTTNINLTDTFAPAAVTVSNSAKTFALVGPGSLTGLMALTKQGPGTLVLDNVGSNDFTGGVTIGGGTLQVGAADTNGNLPLGPVVDNGALVFAGADTVRLPNSISGTGSLQQIGPGTLQLSGVSSFTGATLVSGGTIALTGSGAISNSTNIVISSGAGLDVTGLAGQSLTLNSPQVLNGFGSVLGSILAAAGSSIAPGSNSVTGGLTASGNLALNGSTFMKLNKTAQTNDTLSAGGTLTYGGTLILTSLSGPLNAGDSFKLFSASTYNGAFAQLVPTVPAVNLVWNTNTLANGILTVVAAQPPPPVFTSVTRLQSNLVFSGTNGVPGSPYYLATSADLTLPLNQWQRIATNSFDNNGNFSFTNALNSNTPKLFYRLQLQ